MTSSSGYEARFHEALSALLGSLPVGGTRGVDPSEQLCFAMELLLPALLGEKYTHWRFESLDGFFDLQLRRTGAASAHLEGMAVVISDQSVVPFVFQVALAEEGIGSFQLGLAADGEDAMSWTEFGRVRGKGLRMPEGWLYLHTCPGTVHD